ncbi:MAG: hypothetical protein AAB771_00065 [Patescibacteria group bacterium]
MEKHKKRKIMAMGFVIGFLIGFELSKERDEKFKFKAETDKIFKEADKLENKIKEEINKQKRPIENFIE